MTSARPHHVGDIHLSDAGHDALIQLCWRFGVAEDEVLDGAAQAFAQFITGQIDQELTVMFPDKSAIRVRFLPPPPDDVADQAGVDELGRALSKLRYEVFVASEKFSRNRELPEGSAGRMSAYAADLYAVQKRQQGAA